MSFPRYEAYKDSGAEWLGNMPAHWGHATLRRLAQIFSGGTPDKANQDFWSEGTIPWLNSGAVNQVLITEPSAYITEAGFQGSSAKWVPCGSLVMALAGQGKTKGMVAQTAITATCNQSMAAIVAQEEIRPRFLFWWLFSNYENIRNLSGGDLRDGLNLDLLSGIRCPLPSSHEQEAVVVFLDRETAKIDALVEAQQQLIALLKEKRQAAISHAVIKGLDAGAPMKNSGVEWLCEVPAHWEVGAIKRFVTFLDGRRVPLSAEERGLKTGDFPYYGASGIIDYIDDYLFNEDLVLVSEDGANLLNRSTPIAFVASGQYWVNNHAHILKPLDMNLVYWAERIEAVDLTPMVTGSAQPKLTIDALANLNIAVPAAETERAAIGDFIEKCRLSLNPLIVQAETAIVLLQERRSALISAAVTGKIDVRGLAPSQAEAA